VTFRSGSQIILTWPF